MIDYDSALSLCALEEVIRSHRDLHPSLAPLLDIDDEQATVRSCSDPSAHSRLRSGFWSFCRTSLSYMNFKNNSIVFSHHCPQNSDWTDRVEVVSSAHLSAHWAVPLVLVLCGSRLVITSPQVFAIFCELQSILSVHSITPGLLSGPQNRCTLFIVSCAVLFLPGLL